MERESNPMEALCRSGCGFYGNPSTDGLCSVCFKEALKKKQQPPATTPSPVSAPFVPAAPVPAPAPTPLAAAAPTVPSLPVQPLQHTDAQQAREESLNESKCPTGNIQKLTIMENDPNKKDSKGKRLFKKASRRNSKTSNGSQQSLEQGISVSRSKSFENNHRAIEINDSTPLPTPEGPTDKSEHNEPKLKSKTDKTHLQNALTILDVNGKKIVDIQEERNEVYEEIDTVSRKGSKSSSLKLDKNNEQSLEPGSSKRGVKRKLEEESGAGTSGTSTGASDTDADDKDPSKDKKKKNRCAVCRKKVGLTGFECRCGGLFCAVHRYSDKHECSFDYRELGAQEIRRNNPVVVSQKIHKI